MYIIYIWTIVPNHTDSITPLTSNIWFHVVEAIHWHCQHSSSTWYSNQTWQRRNQPFVSYPYLVGFTVTILKNISKLGLLFPIYGKIKNLPNHQPDMVQWCSHSNAPLLRELLDYPMVIPVNWIIIICPPCLLVVYPTISQDIP